MLTKDQIKNEGGLLTDHNGYHLGYICIHQGMAFEPNHGKVEVSAEEAEIHNRTLSRCEISGLDECPIGQGRVFYLVTLNDIQLQTWFGDRVPGSVGMYGLKVVLGRVAKKNDWPGNYEQIYEGRLKSADSNDVMMVRVL